MLRIIHFFLILFLLPSFSDAQQKGAVPIKKNTDQNISSYAVVIGISSYQHEDIPDLKFAHKDAEAFVSFLKSASGGSLSEDQIMLLTNERATTAQIVAALDWLTDKCKKGDKAIIYFSGHGDIEKISKFERGFLLTYDSPPNSYYAGAFPLFGLQDIIMTLSSKEVKVLMVSDACRSGKLAGSAFNGSQATTAELSRQFANEVKILSCQPNEFSWEGEQWGGGRGAFSYHLVGGLYGLADRNTNKEVSLSEIDRYLEDHVTPEVAPASQIPMTIGNKTELMAIVDKEQLALLRNNRNQLVIPFSAVENRNFEENMLANIDSNIVALYHLFQNALQQKQFFKPVDSCVEDLYVRLIGEPELAPLKNGMKRNYAAALQDDVQQALNRMIANSEREARIWFSPARVNRTYSPYPRMLERASELLGEQHYMYRVLQARKTFFEAGIIYLQKVFWKDRINGLSAIKKFRESLTWQPKVPHTLMWLAMTYHYNMTQSDSALFYIDQTIENAPAWFLPNYWKVRFLIDDKRFDEAKTILDKWQMIDSTNVNLMEGWSAWYFFQGRFEKSLDIQNKVISIDSSGFMFKMNRLLPLGFLGRKEETIKAFNEVIRIDSTYGKSYYLLGNMYYLIGEIDNAIIYFKQALQVDPSMIWIYSHLGDALILSKRYVEAEVILLNGFSKDSTYMPLVNALGGVYLGTKDWEKAVRYYQRAIELDDTNMAPFYNLASVYASTGRYQKALKYLDTALIKGMDNYEYLQNDPSFSSLQKLPEYENLMKKYFPEKYSK